MEETRNVSAQELYELVRLEMERRAQIKGFKVPAEEEIFKVVVQEARRAVERGDAPAEFLDELAEVKPKTLIDLEKYIADLEQAEKSGIVVPKINFG